MVKISPDRTSNSRWQWSPVGLNQEKEQGGEDNSDEI